MSQSWGGIPGSVAKQVWGIQHLVWEGGFQISAYSNAIQGYKRLHDTIHDPGSGHLKGKDTSLSFSPKEQ